MYVRILSMKLFWGVPMGGGLFAFAPLLFLPFLMFIPLFTPMCTIMASDRVAASSAGYSWLVEVKFERFGVYAGRMGGGGFALGSVLSGGRCWNGCAWIDGLGCGVPGICVWRGSGLGAEVGG
jgi:hypothetical protein